MNNSLFNILGPNINRGNDFMNLISQFNQFRQMYSGGDPRQQVQSLLRSGQMSQEQFKQLAEQADQLRAFFK